MLKSTLVTAAASLGIIAGALGISTVGASADSYHGGYQSSRPYHPGWQGNGWHGQPHVRGPARMCQPIVRTVKFRGHYGWHWKRIVVGERCHQGYRGW